VLDAGHTHTRAARRPATGAIDQSPLRTGQDRRPFAARATETVIPTRVHTIPRPLNRVPSSLELSWTARVSRWMYVTFSPEIGIYFWWLIDWPFPHFCATWLAESHLGGIFCILYFHCLLSYPICMPARSTIACEQMLVD